MITLTAGKLGVGKSYVATVKVWRTILSGRDCYVNWDIDFTKYALWRERFYYWPLTLWRKIFGLKKWGKVYRFYELSELYTIRNGEVFYDEAHADLDSRHWQSLPQDFVRKLTQSRKYGLNLHFISQHAKQVDVVILRLANEFIQHYKFLNLFYWKIYDGEHIEHLSNPAMLAISRPKNSGFGFVLFSKRFAKSYDTFGIFGKQFKMWERPPMWERAKIFDDNILTTKEGWLSKSG